MLYQLSYAPAFPRGPLVNPAWLPVDSRSRKTPAGFPPAGVTHLCLEYLLRFDVEMVRLVGSTSIARCRATPPRLTPWRIILSLSLALARDGRGYSLERR